jgi:hypothetical protein
LANIVRISEHDVDWVAAAMTYMEKHGFATIEPTAEAEERWMDKVFRLAERTLVSKAKTWYVGANVSGKPQDVFTGGFHKYREHCAAAVQSGYRDFAFERSEVRAAARIIEAA